MSPEAWREWIGDLKIDDPTEGPATLTFTETHGDGEATVEVQFSLGDLAFKVQIDQGIKIDMLRRAKNPDLGLLVRRDGEWIAVIGEIKRSSNWRASTFDKAW